MNQKLENEDNHPPSGLISKIKKWKPYQRKVFRA